MHSAETRSKTAPLVEPGAVIRWCTECGKQNRIPSARLSDSARCGQCKTRLGPLAEPLNVGTEAFQSIIRSAKVPILVDFWAEWCGPCRMAAPAVERVARELSGKALVLKVNSDHHPELANEFQVRGIPNFVVLKGGRKVFQQAGLVDHRELRRWLEQAM